MRILTDIAAASVVTRQQQERINDETPVASVAPKPLGSLSYVSAGTKIQLPRDVFGWAAGERPLQDPIIVLVIEDDQSVQSIVEEALTDGGFEPAIATSGEEAVTLLKGGKTKYCALVTDIHLRGTMDGWEVARQARQIDPAFPVIYMTGAAADKWGSLGVPNSILVTKPFAPAQLVTAVSNLLNTGTSPT